jgi:hypothetical protein
MTSCSVENKITKEVIEISSLIQFWWPKKVKKILSIFSHILKNVKICLDLISFFVFRDINAILAAELWLMIRQ